MAHRSVELQVFSDTKSIPHQRYLFEAGATSSSLVYSRMIWELLVPPDSAQSLVELREPMDPWGVRRTSGGSAGPLGGPPDPLGVRRTHGRSAGHSECPPDLKKSPPDLHQPIRMQQLKNWPIRSRQAQTEARQAYIRSHTCCCSQSLMKTQGGSKPVRQSLVAHTI